MRRNSCAVPAPNPKLASHMSAPVHPTAAIDGLTIGRGALQQFHRSLLRDAADAAIPILQEVGFAAGEGIYQAFCAWLPPEGGLAHPGDLDAGRLNDVLSTFFQAIGWGAVSVAPFCNASRGVASRD